MEEFIRSGPARCPVFLRGHPVFAAEPPYEVGKVVESAERGDGSDGVGALPQKISGIDGFGLRVVRREPIEIATNEKDEFYMYTKYTKMGHLLHIKKPKEK